MYVVQVEGKDVPYYVGLGSLNRPYQPHGTAEKPTNVNNIRILSYNMSDVDARQAEILLIALYERKWRGGILVNTSEGGEGLPDFYTPIMETKSYAFDIEWWQHNPDFRLIEKDGYWVGNHMPVYYKHNLKSWSKTINPLPPDVLQTRRIKRKTREQEENDRAEVAYYRHKRRMETGNFA